MVRDIGDRDELKVLSEKHPDTQTRMKQSHLSSLKIQGQDKMGSLFPIDMLAAAPLGPRRKSSSYQIVICFAK